MKGQRRYSSKYLALLVLFVICSLSLTVLAAGETVSPIPAEKLSEPISGKFGLELKNAGKHSKDGFTAELYDVPVYKAEDIEAIRESDRIDQGDAVWTVKDIIPREDGSIEIIVVEPELDGGYISFFPSGDGKTYSCILADENFARRYIGTTEVKLPLPESFLFIDAGVECTSDDFLKIVDADSSGKTEDYGNRSIFTRYNTTAIFENGMLIKVERKEYGGGADK